MADIKFWKTQKIAIFIDIQNLWYAAKNHYNKLISYEKLLKFIVRNRPVIRSIAYVVESESDQTQFLKLMRNIGCDIRSKDLIVRSDGSCKGDWDVAIAVDAIRLSEKVDAVVLVSGDGDFTYLVDVLKNSGTRVEVVSIRDNTAESLVNSADEYREIGPDLMMSYKKTRRKHSKPTV